MFNSDVLTVGLILTLFSVCECAFRLDEVKPSLSRSVAESFGLFPADLPVKLLLQKVFSQETGQRRGALGLTVLVQTFPYVF